MKNKLLGKLRALPSSYQFKKKRKIGQVKTCSRPKKKDQVMIKRRTHVNSVDFNLRKNRFNNIV